MSITTRSKFYYGHTVDEDNRFIDFNEGASDLIAEIQVGKYSLEEYAIAVQNALTNASQLPQDYTVTVDRATRQLTVSSDAAFSLLVSSGPTVASAWSLMGFTGADRSGADTYTGDSASGKEYKPQFTLQRYTPFAHWKDLPEATLNKSPSGNTEVVSFGSDNFSEFEIDWITDKPQSKGFYIEDNPTGVSDFTDFADTITEKGNFEFMPDRDTPGTFFKCILEILGGNSTGTGFKLIEKIDQSLPLYYRSGLIKIRDLS